MSPDTFRFPSGRSVGNCRNDAKRLAQAQGISLAAALDQVALLNGGAGNWGVAMTVSLQPPAAASVEPVAAPPSLMTAADIQAVLAEHPITPWGYGVAPESIKRAGSYEAALQAEQADLATAIEHCNKAIRFLQHVERRKTANIRIGTSYGLKHQVERFTRLLVSAPTDGYLTNGALICAAVHLGFSMEVSPGSPNPTFNMSSKSPVFEWQRLSARRPATPKEFARLEALSVELGVRQEHTNPFKGRPI